MVYLSSASRTRHPMDLNFPGLMRFFNKLVKIVCWGIGGSRGGARDAIALQVHLKILLWSDPPPPLGPNSFIFMQFSVKIWSYNRLAPPPPHLGSWYPLVWEILDPPLGWGTLLEACGEFWIRPCNAIERELNQWNMPPYHLQNNGPFNSLNPNSYFCKLVNWIFSHPIMLWVFCLFYLLIIAQIYRCLLIKSSQTSHA